MVGLLDLKLVVLTAWKLVEKMVVWMVGKLVVVLVDWLGNESD